MSLTLIGDCTFAESCPPAPGKNDWGVDTLVRKLTGAQSLRAAFEATLGQGQTYSYNSVTYYLQTWQWDDRVAISTVTLNYKGLRNGTPNPVVINEIVGASGSTSANFETKNNGLGVIYRTELVLDDQGNPKQDDGQGAPFFIGIGGFKYKNIYCLGAQMEFTYNAGQTVYRYIANGQPSSPTNSALGFSYTPRIKRVRVTTNDGATFGILMPLAIGSALEPAMVVRAVGFSSQPIFGTPYFECQDTVRADLAAIGA